MTVAYLSNTSLVVIHHFLIARFLKIIMKIGYAEKQIAKLII